MKMLYKIKSGSHLYGLITPTSDIDYIGVYIEDTLEDFLDPFNTKDEIDLSVVDKLENGKNSNDAVDEKYYSLRKFIKLCSECSPNIFEMLYAPDNCIEYIDPLFKKYFIDTPEMFLNKKVIDRFIGYAKSQEQKSYTKSENCLYLEKFKLGIQNIMDRNSCTFRICDLIEKDSSNFSAKFKNHYNLIPGAHGDTILEVGGMKFPFGITLKEAVSRIEDRFSRASHRVDGILINKYEPKFMSHTVRLLIEGIQILQTGKISLPFTGYDKDVIMRIKLGLTPIKDIPYIVNTYKDIFSMNEEKYNNKLPQSPDYNKIKSCFYNFIQDTFINKN